MKRVELRGLFFAFFLAISIDSIAEGAPISLIVLVDGASASTGQAIVSLFSSKDNYLKKPVFEKIQPIDNAGKAKFIFDEVKAGVYAISVVYDEDSDGKLNRGFLGIPTELVGFSNNTNGKFGPPSFHRAMFTLSESQTISISLGRVK